MRQVICVGDHDETTRAMANDCVGDVSAATRVGFRGAYCSVWENEALTDLFGEMDVLSDTLPELADRVIAATK